MTTELLSSSTDGTWRLISRCAILGANPIWRVNRSSTQARQIHSSLWVTDSGGSADTSSASNSTTGLRMTPEELLLSAPAVFIIFAGDPEGLPDLFCDIFEAVLVRFVGILFGYSISRPCPIPRAILQ